MELLSIIAVFVVGVVAGGAITYIGHTKIRNDVRELRTDIANRVRPK